MSDQVETRESSPPKKRSNQDIQSIGQQGYERDTISSRAKKKEEKLLPLGFQIIPKSLVEFVPTTDQITYFSKDTREICLDLKIMSFELPGDLPEMVKSISLKFNRVGGCEGDGDLEKGTCTISHTLLDAKIVFENFSHYFINTKYSFMMIQKLENTDKWHTIFSLDLERSDSIIEFKNTPALLKGFSRYLNLNKSLADNEKNYLSSHNNIEFQLAIKGNSHNDMIYDFHGCFEGDTQRTAHIYFQDSENSYVAFSLLLLEERCKYLYNNVSTEGLPRKVVKTDENTLEQIREYLQLGKITLKYTEKYSIDHCKNYVALYKAARKFGLQGLSNKILYYLYYSQDITAVIYLDELVKYQPEDLKKKLDNFKSHFKEELEVNTIYQEYLKKAAADAAAEQKKPNKKEK